MLKHESTDAVPVTPNEELCRRCAEWAFDRWRGWCSAGTEHWAEKPDLPAVPQLHADRCPRCGGSEGLSVARIVYRSVHGEFNTGLPDYYVLVVLKESPTEGDSAQRWGRPYRDAWVVDRIPLDELEERIRTSRYQ